MQVQKFWSSEERRHVATEVVTLWGLAWPVSTTFFLNMSLSTVSVLFVGHLGPSKLAAASLGSSLAQVTGVAALA
jgi:MATE family multidrug resistance protein